MIVAFARARVYATCVLPPFLICRSRNDHSVSAMKRMESTSFRSVRVDRSVGDVLSLGSSFVPLSRKSQQLSCIEARHGWIVQVLGGPCHNSLSLDRYRPGCTSTARCRCKDSEGLLGRCSFRAQTETRSGLSLEDDRIANGPHGRA